jgi:hypothetical protein
MFLLSDLVSPRTWLAMIHHLAGLFIGIAAYAVFTTGLSLGFSLLVVVLVGLPVLGVTMRMAEAFSHAERARFAFLLGVRIPAWPAGARAGYRWGVVPRWRMLTERATWGDIGYAFLRLPVSAVTATISVTVWALGLVMLALPWYNRYLPRGGVEFGNTVLHTSSTTTVLSALGLVVLIAAAQLTRGVAVSRRLLGPPSDLAARVSELEVSRERVVDAAEAERRRIENSTSQISRKRRSVFRRTSRERTSQVTAHAHAHATVPSRAPAAS